MVQTVVERGTVGESSSVRDTYLKAYRVMLLARVLDDKFASLYRGGKIHGGVFLGRGQEALSVATGLCLRTPTTIATQPLKPITLKTGPAFSGPARYKTMIGAISARYIHHAWREKRIAVLRTFGVRRDRL